MSFVSQSDQGQQYLKDMTFCQEYAWENRPKTQRLAVLRGAWPLDLHSVEEIHDGSLCRGLSDQAIQKRSKCEKSFCNVRDTSVWRVPNEELSMKAWGDKTRNTPWSCMGEDGRAPESTKYWLSVCQLILFQESRRSPRCIPDFSYNVILRSTFITTTVNVKLAGATKSGICALMAVLVPILVCYCLKCCQVLWREGEAARTPRIADIRFM